MLTVYGAIMAVIAAYAMLIPANEKYIPGLALIAAAGGLVILIDILRHICGLPNGIDRLLSKKSKKDK